MKLKKGRHCFECGGLMISIGAIYQDQLSIPEPTGIIKYFLCPWCSQEEAVPEAI